MRHWTTRTFPALAGLNQRSPLLAATMTLAMVSLAGIPPLAGFFGKFLLLKAVIEQAQATGNHGYYCLAFTALAGVVISLYYYFGVIRAIYWSKEHAGFVADSAFRAGQVLRLRLHRRHVLDRPVSEHGAEPRHGSGQST